MPNKRVVFETEWFSVEAEDFPDIALLGGKPYYRVVENDGVCMLVMTKKREIIMVRQFRPAPNSYTLEMPAGSLDEGENNIAAATRELYEETGYVCSEWTELSALVDVMASRSSMRSSLVFGRDAVWDARFVPKENIQVVLVSPEKLKKLILSGECRQSIVPGMLALATWKNLVKI